MYPTKIDRPWGRMWLLLSTPRLWVKVIEVDPGHCTSYQYHIFRKELHISLDGTTMPWRDLHDYVHAYWRIVPRFRAHRLATGRYLEIAWGQPDEDDIVRLSDNYGRATNTGVPDALR